MISQFIIYYSMIKLVVSVGFIGTFFFGIMIYFYPEQTRKKVWSTLNHCLNLCLHFKYQYLISVNPKNASIDYFVTQLQLIPIDQPSKTVVIALNQFDYLNDETHHFMIDCRKIGNLLKNHYDFHLYPETLLYIHFVYDHEEYILPQKF